MRDKILKMRKMIKTRVIFATKCERVPFFFGKVVFLSFAGRNWVFFEKVHKNCRKHEKYNNKPNSYNARKKAHFLILRDTILIIPILREMRVILRVTLSQKSLVTLAFF